MSRRLSMLAVLFTTTTFAFSLPGLVNASEYSYEELVQRMAQLEQKVDHGLVQKSTFQLRLTRQVKFLESRIAEMTLQQAESDRKNAMLETRINQLEKQVKKSERTTENQQMEIKTLKESCQEKLIVNTTDDKQGLGMLFGKQSNDSEMKQNPSKQGSLSTSKDRRIRRSFPEVPFAFTAVLDHNVLHSGIEQTVIFNKVLLNDGNAYNNRTGMFTVQKDGVYMFYLAFGVGYEPHKLWMHIVVDGVGQVSGVADTLQAGHDAQGTNLVLLHLHKGDLVWVTTYAIPDVKIYGLSSFTTFSGVLLYEY